MQDKETTIEPLLQRNASLIALCGILVLCVIVAVVALANIDGALSDQNAAYELRKDLHDVLLLVVDQETGIRGFSASQEPLFLQPYYDAQPKITGALEDIHQLEMTPGLESAAPFVDRFEKTDIQWLQEAAQPIIIDPRSKSVKALQHHGKDIMDKMREQINSAVLISQRGIDEAKLRVKRLIVISIVIIMLGTLLLGALSVVLDTKRRRDVVAFTEQLAQKNLALERSNSALQEFAYVASHDLQEPLRTISSFAQLLSKRYRGKLDTSADEFIDYVVEGAKRMQRLINDLLELSRVNTKGTVLASTDLAACAKTALANLQVSIAERGALVHIGLMPIVLGDRSQLTQLLQNLIGNALKYCEAKPPKIEVTSAKVGHHWRISVADNGIGIAPEFRERIFRMFARLHTREEYSGTGIGLALCKSIIERHGGEIGVENNPTGGSIFWFTLQGDKR